MSSVRSIIVSDKNPLTKQNELRTYMKKGERETHELKQLSSPVNKFILRKKNVALKSMNNVQYMQNIMRITQPSRIKSLSIHYLNTKQPSNPTEEFFMILSRTST